MDPDSHRELTRLSHQYVMPESARKLLVESNPLIVCGVTAAGKGTLSNMLIQHGEFQPVISHTTRQPRANHGILEQNGVEYWFVTERQMLDMIINQELLEVKDIHAGTYYGKSISELQKIISLGKRPIFDIDVKGALEFIKIVPSLKPIFLLPPSYDVWMERLGTRGLMTDIERRKRLVSARHEIQTAIRNPQFILLINHEVELTIGEVLRGTYDNPESQHKAHHLATDFLQYLKDL
jgi:guanylate kinase